MKQVIKIAKANEADIRSTEMLLELLERIFYGDSVDDMPIFKKIWHEMGYPAIISNEDVAVIKLEIIRRYFSNCSGRWVKVINTTDLMVSQICSNEVAFIELHPFLKRAVNGEIMGE